MSEAVTETAPVVETAPVAEATETKATETKVDWYEQFKGSLDDKARKSIEKYKDGDSFKNGVFSAFSMIGKKGDIPAPDADEKTKVEFWNKLGADKIELGVPELGEEYGDLGGQLKEYYGGINKRILEIAKGVIPKSGNINEMLSGIVKEFIARDAEATLERERATKAQAQETLAKVAARAGLTPDKLMKTNEEVVKKYGWTNETTIPEILYTLARETSNSTELKDSYLHNTGEGLQAQIDEINRSGVLDTTGPKKDAALARKKELMKKMADMMQK